MRWFRTPRRRLSKLRRSPKIFVPGPSGRQLVIPFRPISAVLIVFLFASTVYFLLRSDVFQVKELRFKFEKPAFAEASEGGSSMLLDPSEEALVRQRISEEVLGRSTIFLDSEGVEERIKQEFPTIKAIEVEKELPASLSISVSVRVPLARVVVGENKALLVDAEGLLFREASDESLPTVDLGESFAGVLGEVIGGDEVKAYLETLDCVGEKGLGVVSISLKPGAIELELESGPTVLLSVERSSAEQVEILVKLLKRLRTTGRVPVVVDLRFVWPVVRF